MKTKSIWFDLVVLLFASIGASASPVDAVSTSSLTRNAAPSPSSPVPSESPVSAISSSASSHITSSASASSSNISFSSGASAAVSTSLVSPSASSSALATSSTASSSTQSEKPSTSSSVPASSTDSFAAATSSSQTLTVITPSSRSLKTSPTSTSSLSSSVSGLSAQVSSRPISAARETSSLSTGAIVGISLAVVAALIAFVVGLLFIHKRRQRRRRHSEAGQYLHGSDNAWGYSDVKSPAPPAGILHRSRSHSPPLSARYTPVASEMDEVATHSQLQVDVPAGSSAGPSDSAGREERLVRMKSYRTTSTASFYPTSDMLPTPSDDDPRSPFYSPSPEEENAFVPMRYADGRSIAETTSIYSTDSYESRHSGRTSTGPDTPRGPRAAPIA